MARLVLCALLAALLLPASSPAAGVDAGLLDALLRLPTVEARRDRLIRELSAPELDDLSKEQLGSALAVLGTLAKDKRDDEYVVRLYLDAALSPDPARRDEALEGARRGRGPPAPQDDSEAQAEAARYLLDRELLFVRGREPRLHVVDHTEWRLPLSRFVYRVRDEEIRAVLERQSRTSWQVFGGLFAGGFASAVAGGLSLVAGSDTGFDGSGGGRAPDQAAARAAGTTLIAAGTAAVVAGAIQRSVVATNHRVGYRRFYDPQRLRAVVRRHNERAAAELGVPDDGP